MGNVLVAEEEPEPKFLEDGFNLEAPDADQKINFGTAAPNCQPRHTVELQEEVGHEVNIDDLLKENEDDEADRGGKENRDQDEDVGQDELDDKDPKKLSYLQMAKLGYQELVNAIIRPPRADYKVC